MSCRFVACVLLALAVPGAALEVVKSADAHKHGKHHHHHHKGKHHHHKHHHGKDDKEVQAAPVDKAAPKAEHKAEPKADPKAAPKTVAKPNAAKATIAAKPVVAAVAAVKMSRDEQLVAKMKAIETRLAEEKKKRAEAPVLENGHLLVSGPLPADFSQRFIQSVAAATGVDSKKVSVTKTSPVKDQPGVMAVDFKAPKKVVLAVETQSADPDSKLTNGNLHSFLVAKDEDEQAATPEEKKEEEAVPKSESEATPVEQKGIDIDTAMPYGDLEPFGREDTAQELTEDSVKESDSMVDQLERAEVAEEKRSVFRALTRLRGAAITSFDGVARSQTGNIDEYNKIHKWRNTHPLHHLADEESDISKWAFPDNADF